MHGVSLIIPTRNEADNIDLLLQRIFQVDYLQSIDHEVIFVDDSSTDGTRTRVRSWCTDHPVRLIERDGRGGLASAVIAGARQARFAIGLVMDADLSHPPEKIAEILEPLLAGECDMVIGSRYVKGGATPEWPASRKIASKLATLPARLFTDVNDPMAGFFGVTIERLANLRPDVPGFKIGLEVLVAGGDELRVKEVPIVFNDRFEGFSKMNKQIIFEYLKQVLQLGTFDLRAFSFSRLLLLGVFGTLFNTLIFAVARHNGYQPLIAHLFGITSSSLLLFVIMALLWQKSDLGHRLSLRHLGGLVVLLILAMSMQGGLFQLLSRWQIFTETAAFSGGALLGTTFFITASTLYLFSGFTSLSRQVRSRLMIIGTILWLIALRLVYLGLPELMEQEAYYWNYAQHLDLSYLDHPPMVALLIWLGTALFGITEFGVRIGAYVCWFFTAYFSYRLAAAVFSRTAALGSVLLISILPLYFGTGLIITPDAPLHAAWAALIYFLYCGLVQGRASAWLGVGISLGVGMVSKYTIVLLAPGVLVFMLLDRRARQWFIRWQPYAAVLIAVALFMPVLIWNFQHDWVSFLFQSEQRVSGQTFFSTHRLIGYIAMIITPAGVLSALLFFFRGNRIFSTQASGSEHGSDVEQRSIGRINRNYLFSLLLVLAPLSVFLLFSLTREVKLNWTSPLWLAALPFFGLTASGWIPALRSRFLTFLQGFWKLTALVMMLAYSVALHYVTLGLPGVSYPSEPFLLGWKEMAAEVEAILDQVEEKTGNRPVVVGMDPYQISSGLAFYRAKMAGNDADRRRRAIEETLGWHLFGWNSLMYEYWEDPADFYGRDILAVASSKIRVEYPYYQNHMISMNNIHPLDAIKDGQVVNPFYFRLVRGYRSTD